MKGKRRMWPVSARGDGKERVNWRCKLKSREGWSVEEVTCKSRWEGGVGVVHWEKGFR